MEEFLSNSYANTSAPIVSALVLGLLTAISPCPMVTNITDTKRGESRLRDAAAESQRLLELAERSRAALLSVVEDQKSAEEQIRMLNADLEARVERRTAQLEAANKELESFAYSVSHDLRAPLRAMGGYSRILQEDFAEDLGDEGLRVTRVISDSAKSMGQPIDDRFLTFILALFFKIK